MKQVTEPGKGDSRLPLFLTGVPELLPACPKHTRDCIFEMSRCCRGNSTAFGVGRWHHPLYQLLSEVEIGVHQLGKDSKDISGSRDNFQSDIRVKQGRQGFHKIRLKRSAVPPADQAHWLAQPVGVIELVEIRHTKVHASQAHKAPDTYDRLLKAPDTYKGCAQYLMMKGLPLPSDALAQRGLPAQLPWSRMMISLL